jgi:hypothetical protein
LGVMPWESRTLPGLTVRSPRRFAPAGAFCFEGSE